MDKLTIFVSGTIEDMKSERKAVSDAIHSLHLDAIRAETEYSEDQSSREKCLEMARDCDVYLGVYNKTRYGWKIPGDVISVTEMEYKEAQAHKKPMRRKRKDDGACIIGANLRFAPTCPHNGGSPLPRVVISSPARR